MVKYCQGLVSVNILGILSQELCDNDDMSRQYKRIAQGNALIRKFYMCAESVKCTLFN